MRPTRNRNRRPFLIMLLSFAAFPILFGHDTTTLAASSDDASRVEAPAHSLDDLTWLAGSWRGSGFGGHCEETWSEPAGGAIMGMFRLLRDDQVVFYEFMQIVEHEGQITLEIKHFTPDFVGWEEKSDAIRFPLLEAGDGFARFDGLTMQQDDDGSLDIMVTLETDEGKVRKERVQLRPVER